MRILAAQDRMDPNEFLLELQCLEIVSNGHQVCFGRKTVRGMAPIAGTKYAELLAREQSADAVLHTLEILLARHRPIGDRLRELRCFCWVSLQGRGNIHPVQCMKLVEMDDVILHRLRCSNDVANQAGVVGDFDPQGILNRSDRRQCVDRRADSANALRPNPGFARIPAPQDHLNSPEHRAGTPSVRDHPASTWASIRRCPSIRVTGSTTIRAIESPYAPRDSGGSIVSSVVAFGRTLSRTISPTTCVAIAAAIAPVATHPIWSAVTSTPNPGTDGNRL